jgi:hypothetical protein
MIKAQKIVWVLLAVLSFQVNAAESLWWFGNYDLRVISMSKDRGPEVGMVNRLSIRHKVGDDYALIKQSDFHIITVNGQKVDEKDLDPQIKVLLQMSPAIAVNAEGEIVDFENFDQMLSKANEYFDKYSDDESMKAFAKKFIASPEVKQMILTKSLEFWSYWLHPYYYKDLELNKDNHSEETQEFMGDQIREKVSVKKVSSQKQDGLEEVEILRATVGDSFKRLIFKAAGLVINTMEDKAGKSIEFENAMKDASASRVTRIWSRYEPGTYRPDEVTLKVVNDIKAPGEKKANRVIEKKYKFMW